MKLTKEDRIRTIYGRGRHVVINGAGASIASKIRKSVMSVIKPPSKNNFIDVLKINDIVDSAQRS